MWAALKYAAEKKADDGGTRPNLLLLDEPELCLHPDAIREACSVLYNLPVKKLGDSPRVFSRFAVVLGIEASA
jgi:predicted ATP-dependent endonuclease of OLD family